MVRITSFTQGLYKLNPESCFINECIYSHKAGQLTKASERGMEEEFLDQITSVCNVHTLTQLCHDLVI